MIALVLAAIPAPAFEFNDSHFHLTNYVQKGPSLEEFLKTCMGDRVGRVALFGIPRETEIIRAHTGLGRVIHPPRSAPGAAERSPRHREIVAGILDDLALRHVYFEGGRRRVRAWEKANLH